MQILRFDGQRVLICDDLLATGGTAKAAAKLIEKIKGQIVGFAFIKIRSDAFLQSYFWQEMKKLTLIKKKEMTR